MPNELFKRKTCEFCKRHNNLNPKHKCKEWGWGKTCDRFEYSALYKSFNYKKRK